MNPKKFRPRTVAVLGILALTVVSGLDYYVPVDVQFLILYLIPLVFVSMRNSMRVCAFVCLWAATGWWLANYLSTGTGVWNGVRLWNTLSRGIIFFSFVSLLHYFKAQLSEKEAAMAILRKAKQDANPVMGIRRICGKCDNVEAKPDEWLPVKAWLARDCNVSWADSSCPDCRSEKP